MDRKNPVFVSLEEIERRISEKLTVENLASGVYFSKYHYSRLFREIVGESVMEYVTKRRLTLAGRALLETNDSVLDISLQYGYDSHEGFTRSFRAYMGVTPTEYRRYGLTAISRETVKERISMTYSKTTDEILRELNELTVKIKETADSARKMRANTPLWSVITDKTDLFADTVKDAAERVAAIPEHPDEITNRFAIIRTLEDVAIMFNVVALNAALVVSRAPEQDDTQQDLCRMYIELAGASVLKSGKIVKFFNELAALIIDDMRKTAETKLSEAVQAGAKVAERFTVSSNIKGEVESLVSELSDKLAGDVTAPWLEGCLFKLEILSFAAEIEDSGKMEAFKVFRARLSEALDFFNTLVMPENNPATGCTTHKLILDIAFQTNVLLFYTRGEIEKLNDVLKPGQKEECDAICGKANDFIRLATSDINEPAYREIADRLYNIVSDLNAEADRLGKRGGSIKLLSGEYNNLADKVMSLVLADA